MNTEDLIDRRVFTNEFRKILEQLRICEEWKRRFDVDLEGGWDAKMSFEGLRDETEKLIFLFSDVFKSICGEDKREKWLKLDTDLSNIVKFMWAPDLAGVLNNPEREPGKIRTAVNQIAMFLKYVKIVMERTLEDVEKKIPDKFVEHALRNAGIIPTFKELRKEEEKE